MITQIALAVLVAIVLQPLATSSPKAQGQAPAESQAVATADPTAAPPGTSQPLDEDELEVLVARIALYPDELVAVISAASLFPLQIVEAARFLDEQAKNKDLKPKESWDASVISLLNYPQIVRMMSDDLDWTQALGAALINQEKDVLVAIQQLRSEAVAKGIIKSDDKIKVAKDADNVVIQSVSQEQVYVPRYEPEMLYQPGYDPVPIGYYPDPYPSYLLPTATFFAGAVTGAAWAAMVDWNDWGIWGGRWNGDIDVGCNRCFNNIDIDGKLKWNDIDWRNVDRSKINIDMNQFANVDRTNIANSIKANSDNNIRKRAAKLRNERQAGTSVRASHATDIRKSTLDGLKGGADRAAARPDGARPGHRPDMQRPRASRQHAVRPATQRPVHATRPAGRPKPAMRADHRPRRPSGLGQMNAGRVSQIHSARGAHAMGGGFHGGGRPHIGGHRGGGFRR